MKVARFCVALLLTTILALSGCSSAPPRLGGSPNVVVSQNGLPAPSIKEAYDSASEYRIGALDLLSISVFGVSDLTQEVRVDAIGNIRLALIGQVHVGGKTTVEVQQEIEAKLKAGFLQSPQVNVFIKEYTSQRVTVEGEVIKPGIIPLTGKTSLLQVIAGAQGLGELADHRGVVVFRVIDGKKMAAVFDIDAIGHGAADDPQVFGDDVIVVSTSGSKDRLHKFIQAVPALGLFRFF